MRPCHRLNLPLGILAALSILTGCFQVPIRGQGDIGENRRTTIIGAKSQNDNREIASYDPYASTAQRIESGNIAALGGTSVTLEPGALAVPANIVIEEGQPLKETSIMSELGIQDSVKVTGSAPSVIVRPEENASLQKPMTLEIPLPSMGLWATMMEDDPYSNVVILARTYRDGEGVVSSLLPRSAFETSNGKARFETTGFGTFQAVVLDTKVEEKIEAKSSEPIRNVANVPVVTDTGIVPIDTITQKEEQPAVAWAPLVVNFDGKTRNITVQAKQVSAFTLSQCRVVLRENVNIPEPLEVLPDTNLSAMFSVTKKEAHTLYARIQCIDNIERTTYSSWSAAIVIPADIKPLPVISSATLASFTADGINTAEHGRSESLVTVVATDYERLAFAIVANPSTTLDCATLSNYVASAPLPSALTADGDFAICVKAINADEAAVYAKTSTFKMDITPPAVASFVGINEAADGIISLAEVSSGKPALEINASGHTKIEFTGFHFAGAICDASQAYTMTVVPAINTLPSADGNYVVCARLSDDVGNTTFKVSATIAKQTGVPTFTGLTLGTAVSDGYLNAADASAGTSLVGVLSASGYSTATYAVATSATSCATIGTWSADVTTNSAGFVSEESYKVCVRLQDSLGNVGYGFSANFMRDITPPVPTGKILTTGESNGTYTLAWANASDNQSAPANLLYCPAQATSASFDTIAQVMGGTMVGACFNGTSALTNVLPAASTYYFNVVVKDQAGNKAVYTKGETQWFTISTPAAATVVGSGTIGSLIMSGSCSPNGVTVSVNSPVSQSATCVANSWSATLDLSAQLDGNISLAASMSDGAGSSALSQSVTIDKNTAAPTATIISGTPAALSNASSLNVTIGGSNVAEYQYALITSPSVCSGATYSGFIAVATAITNSLTTEGVYILCVKGRDANLNTQASATEYSWTRDATPPAATISNQPAPYSNATVLNVTVGGAGVTLYKYAVIPGSTDCGLGSYSAMTPVATPITASLGADGYYTLCVKGQDAAGNFQTNFATHSWTKDVVSPNPTVSGLPNGASSATALSAMVDTNADIAEITYGIGGDGADCGTVTYSGWITNFSFTDNLGTDSNKIFCLKARDQAGNISTPFSHSWTKDTVAPAASISGQPANPSADSSLNVVIAGLGVDSYRYVLLFSASDCSIATYGIDTPVATPITETLGSEGDYKLCVKGKDAAGNEQMVASEAAWTRNSTASYAVLSGQPTNPSNVTSLNVTVAGANIIEYKYDLIDGVDCSSAAYGIWIAVATPITGSVGSDGDKTLCVIGRTTALVEQPIPTIHHWVQDSVAPAVNLTGVPGNPSSISAINITVSSVDGAIEYKYDLLEGAADCSGATYTSWTPLTTPISEPLSTDGFKLICVLGRDAAFNEQVTPFPQSWTRDATAPTVNVGGDLTANTSVTINATTSDASSLTFAWTKTSGPGSITFSNSTGEDTNASATIDGIYTLRLTVTDAAGNSAFNELVFTYDTTPPNITSFIPAGDGADGYLNGIEVTTATGPFAILATDGTSLNYSDIIPGVSVTCDGSKSYPNTSMPVISSVPALDDHYTVCVQVQDLAGNVSYAGATIERDTVAPVFSSFNWGDTASDGFVGSSETALTSSTGTLSESGSSEIRYSAFLNDNTPVTCDGAQTYPNSNLPGLNTMGTDGAYAVCIRLRDAAGNVEYGKTTQLVRDISAPVFTSLVSANDAADGYVNGSEYLSPFPLLTLNAVGHATAHYTDVLLDTALTCNAGQTYTNSSIPAISDIPGADGNYAVCVKLTDSAGNTTHGKSQVIVRDTTAPVFTNLTPANEATDGYINNSESSSTQAFATLTASGQVSTNYTAILPDGPVTCDSSKTYTNSSIPAINTMGADNTYALCVQLSDAAGNITYGKSSSVVKDTTAPTVNAGVDLTASATFTTAATASGADTYTWSFVTAPGSVTFSMVNSLNTSVTAVGDGSYVLRLTAFDFAGNSASDDFTLTWDSTGPQLLSFVGTNEALDGYINTLETSSNLPALSLNALDYSTEEYTTFLDDTVPVTCDAGQSYAPIPIPTIDSITTDGRYVVCVKLVDSSNITAYFKSAVIIRDTQAPTINVTNTPLTYMNSSNFAVTINEISTPQQELAGFQYAKVLSGDGTTTPNCASATYEPKVDVSPAAYSINGNISIVGDGYYALCIKAYDIAGNISPSPYTHTFHLDATPPANATLSGVPGHTNALNHMVYVHGGNLQDGAYYDQFQIAALKASNCSGMTGSETWFNYSSDPTQASINLSQGDGQYVICAKLKDKAGNIQTSYTASSLITLDTTAPVPGNGGIVNLQTVNGATTANISWSPAADAGSGISSYALYASTSGGLTTESEMLVGSQQQLLPDTSSNTSYAITPGTPHTFNIVVTDLAGNRAIYAPTTTRNLMVTSPTSGSTLGFELSGSIMMNGTCQGEGQIIHILSPVPVTNIATCASGGWSTATPIDLGNLTNGNHNVVLRLGQGTNSTADASISLNINKAINTIPNKVGSQGTSSYRVYPNINYGLSVAVSDNELIMAVGAPNDSLDNGGSNPVEEAGAIYLYHRTTAGATWNAPIKLTAPMRMPFQHFGKVIALSGNTLVVGLPEFSSSTMMSSTDMKEYAGAVLVYNYASPSWSTPTMITAPVRHAKDYFGISVAAISGKILVGADGHHAYDGGEINITHREAGKAFLFTQSAGWVFERSFELNVSQLQEYSGFGAKVAMTSDHIVIGAPNFDVDSIDTGAAFAWYWNGSNWTEYGIVQAPLGNRYAYDCFGSSIAILGSYMAIGAPYHDYDSTNTTAVADSGAVYPFIFSTGTWNTGTPAKITIPVTNNRRDSDFFGANVAFSGTTGTPKLLIGAENYQFDASSADQKWGAGAVFIYGYSTGWSTPSTKVLSLGRQQGDGFGASLAGFNTTVAVGIPDFDYDSTGLTNFSPGSGAVYYCNDTICSSLNTTFPTPATQMLASPNGKFGYDLAISEDELTLVVGAPGDNTNTVPTFKEKAGAIYIFHRYDRTQPWTLTQKITPSNLSHDWAAGDQFGFSVDISQDFIIVGAPYHGDNISTGNYLAAAGAAFIFQRSGGVGTAWNQFGSKLIPSGAYGRNANDYFGSSVAIYADGVNVTAAIGAPGHDYDSSDAVSTIVESSGAVFLFIKAGGNFAPDSKIATNLNGSRYAYEKFGTSLDLEGTRLVVGAPQHQYDENGNYPLIDAGAVFVYDKSTQWFPTVKLTANMAAMSNARSGYDYFGYSVALSNNTIVVGAPGHSYDMYGNNPSWDAGGAFVFKFNGSGWSYDAKLLSATRNPGDFFGKMVAVRGRTIGISAPGDDYDLYGGGNYMKDAGAGYIFHKSPTSWDMVQRLAPENSHRQDRDKFGYGIAVSPSALVFGAPEQNYSPASPNLSPDTGAVFTFNRTP